LTRWTRNGAGAAPKAIDDTTRRKIYAIAGSDPRALGQPFSPWSPAKLCDYLVGQGVVAAIGRETLRGILHDGGISWQATKTWKASNDPEFLPKMRRVLDLHDNPPPDGRVVCLGEFGPRPNLSIGGSGKARRLPDAEPKIV
jgi:hypothetical protein